MNVRNLFLVFICFIRCTENIPLSERKDTNTLLNLKAEYDVRFNKLSEDQKLYWPVFKNEYIKKHHLDIKLQLMDAQCKTRMIQSLLMKARFNIFDALNDSKKNEIVVEMNAMTRQIEKDKRMAELCALNIELETIKEFIKIISK